MKHSRGRRERIKAAAAMLAPVVYIVELQGTIAIALERHAMNEGFNAETIIAEAVRCYVGDDQ